MKKIKRLIASLVFLTGVVIVFDIIIPGTLAKIKDSVMISPFIERVDSFTKEKSKDVKKVLGKTVDEEGLNKEEIANTIKNISSQVLQSEVGQAAQEEVGEVFNEATEEIKDLPEEQVKKIKTEVKNQICEGLLKDY